jgi:hypothetical protein
VEIKKSHSIIGSLNASTQTSQSHFVKIYTENPSQAKAQKINKIHLIYRFSRNHARIILILLPFAIFAFTLNIRKEARDQKTIFANNSFQEKFEISLFSFLFSLFSLILRSFSIQKQKGKT